MEKEKEKKEITLEELQQQVADVTSQIKTLQEENTKLKEDLTQKDLEITKLTLGGVQKNVITKETNDNEEISFDFEF